MKITHTCTLFLYEEGINHGAIVLEAQTEEEEKYLFEYFKNEAKQLAEKFPNKERLMIQ